MKRTIKFITHDQTISASDAGLEELETSGEINLAGDSDPRDVSLQGVERVNLHFPKFTDGRAYSQAFLLRRRLGFKGEIRAHGDVLVDQLVQMQRAGFDSAVLRSDQDVAVEERQFDRYASHYQGDAVDVAPHFQRATA